MRCIAGFASLLFALSVGSPRADKLVLVAGGGDGTGRAKAKPIQPFGVDFDSNGHVLIVEMAKGERLRFIHPRGDLITLAGIEGKKGNEGDGGNVEKATFNGMH